MSRSNPIEVLFVDDSRSERRLTAESLDEVAESLYVITEPTVDDGLAWLRDPEPEIDCVVSDFDMPKKDGLDFLKAIRSYEPKIPFILFTGQGSEQVASDAIAAGVTDYLQKNGGQDTYRLLANRIENAVSRYRSEKEVERVYEALEAAEEGVGLLDAEGRFSYVNRAYADLYGYDSGELLDEHWSLLYPDEELPRVREIVQDVRAGESWRGETIGLRKDGSTFLEDHTLVRRDDGGLICSIRQKAERDGA